MVFILVSSSTRYDDYKHEFALRCTNQFTATMIGKIEELGLWIKSKL